MSSEGDRRPAEAADIPGRPHDLILSTEEVLHEQTKSATVKNKNKCRGNRKLQRFRAKLRRQGLNAEAITNLIDGYNRDPPGQARAREESVRKDIRMLQTVRITLGRNGCST